MAVSAAPSVACAVRVAPRSSRDEVVGVKFDRSDPKDALPEVFVRVTAPPDNGKANKEVCRLVAMSLGVAKNRVSVERGQKSRRKVLAVECADSVLQDWIESLPQL